MSPLARPRDRGSRVYGEKHVEKARDTYLSLKPYSTHTVRGLYWLKLSPYFTLFSRMYVPPLPRIQYRSMGAENDMPASRGFLTLDVEGESIMS